MPTTKKTVINPATKDEAALVQPDARSLPHVPIETQIKPPISEVEALKEMPLESLGDYLRYNKETRRMSKEAKRKDKKIKEAEYPMKQCPIELHPTERIVLGRNDQPTNPLPVHLSNEMIHYHETLIPGKTYDLPRCVVEYLASKGTAKWKWFDNPDGSKETRVAHINPRFALRTIYKD